ncbi:DUF4180 domain-containing protein [Paenibacillus thalictri]|uniref:DUF4180 domain-containing protein n=1 Tax=Paenibacillus thalictri TaxID=2527873 RepID=A0A4Q9DHD8_9BACL|nr:DUF4180 domain-containing protein [Paenibacillus thalictri]TBL70437.1 DUF4180 domain-containing protein [Paenibacillus thalictri]
MEISIDQKNGSKAAVIASDTVIIHTVDDALDVMASVRYTADCDNMVLRKEHLSEDFFELKTGLAGSILQKYTNYKMRIAIVGEFGRYNSKSLNDFIYECNQGDSVFFTKTEAEALEKLHRS